MGCLDGITAAITNDCAKQPVRGLVREAYVMNRADASFTVDGTNSVLITAIAMASTKQAWKVTAYRQDMDAGFDLVVSENLPEKYAHYWKIEPWDENSDQIKNLDNLEDLVVVVEREGGSNKDSGDGAFQIYGLDLGLYKSSATQRANDNDGAPVYEFTSREGQQERHSKNIFFDTDYATTKAALEALLTPAP